MNLLDDIRSERLLYWKGLLFLILGLLSAVGLALRFEHWRDYLLLGIAIWAFCRFYYFLFYVIEKYADPGFRFAGIGSFLQYWFRHKKRDPNKSGLP